MLSTKSLKERIATADYFQGYAYSYPHKTAYRAFKKPYSMQEVWQNEDKSALFLYLHVPFCEMRCGFCNLFTVANPKEGLYNPFIEQLKIQSEVTAQALGDFKVARAALGGGTPTYLSLEELEALFSILKNDWNLAPEQIPTMVEASPKTLTEEKMAFLKEAGVTRLSMGVQSFIEEETKALGRPQNPKDLMHAIELLQRFNFPITNLDLIYGVQNQTPDSWKYSLETTVSYQPEEIFLYPLYVRPLTGLGKKSSHQEWTDFRIRLYRIGRDYLLANGYEQKSMRLFKRKNSVLADQPAYHAQENGMVGLGVGARSYTKNLHYSSEYAVGSKSIKPIIQNFNQMTAQDFNQVPYGVILNDEEQKRRYIIKSLCEGSGLSYARYQAFFNSKVMSDFPELAQLFDLGFCQDNDTGTYLNEEGHEHEDIIGPWLYSENTIQKSESFSLV
ncbi:STM4012 family radical SAM protein [Fulvivirga sediminis]|uniref:STM4012 family radical SAM protein n=1 Tax=Fulvivirga sediminis TaxID=2803949 RepID=A0A937F5X2_9BACT|nr:STM4012 family radical SAM protein [Fulvivirga sediminis]MBL3656345.1 STM4012 family radical SAM protein [Fulvivirga sediminis]